MAAGFHLRVLSLPFYSSKQDLHTSRRRLILSGVMSLNSSSVAKGQSINKREMSALNVSTYPHLCLAIAIVITFIQDKVLLICKEIFFLTITTATSADFPLSAVRELRTRVVKKVCDDPSNIMCCNRILRGKRAEEMVWGTGLGDCRWADVIDATRTLVNQGLSRQDAEKQIEQALHSKTGIRNIHPDNLVCDEGDWKLCCRPSAREKKKCLNCMF